MKLRSKRGSLTILIAPSATGKSTLIQLLKKDFSQIFEPLSFTTRTPRKEEKNGVHYFFIKRHEFQKMIDDHLFLEWAEVHLELYGTAKSSIEESIQENKHLICDLNVQGADYIRSYYSHAKTIFLEPPSLEILKARLVLRGTHEKIIRERLRVAEEELQRKKDYDYLILNDSLDNAYSQLKTIIMESMK